ncbi:aminoacyl-tRNA hydrolase [Candidatus Nanosynsacchari sp. TM7_ANC_38.39_G1_1]|uniref:aminoacyl-tRNA hydrolase n=1 Tax=Candidatus Nanosynsacchari sp. TM7_ANC_38.39_G1_1 TaxID=1986206 RepID=UPI00101DE78F|nr:aminoacyl-tRNA hydrolase [Candidatus Nanosynsacchari sp. TM7_ANC_38.39_G1_1]RYC73475.1 Peptidyl-tRNA hydrolase [Candidatus Nanosynsacchari sp. TM7_ANC_38.39_G1_1]
MKVILALGNPGEKYVHTRHNAGFLVIDQLAAGQSAHFSNKPKFSADIAELNMSGEKILLVKPTTYYNEVGISARAILDFYKLTLDDVLIIHDDTALDFGKIRVRKGGRDAGSNGLKSLHAHIGADFWHIRIGTDNLLRRQVSTDRFVMMNFNSDELTILKNWAIPTAQTMIHDFLSDHISAISVKL